MNNVMLITDADGSRYGHAIEKVNQYGHKYIEVRFIDDYENVHTTNWSSFLIFYEVLNYNLGKEE